MALLLERYRYENVSGCKPLDTKNGVFVTANRNEHPV